ncbi:hypothetical protein XFLM_07590 [Xylella fastidiosa subsp. fastidiosa GB514]|nr:hypothetical protein XFLM_07590 [Xylella fastidiosa subsp. fastidiosa GB514]
MLVGFDIAVGLFLVVVCDLAGMFLAEVIHCNCGFLIVLISFGVI